MWRQEKQRLPEELEFDGVADGVAGGCGGGAAKRPIIHDGN